MFNVSPTRRRVALDFLRFGCVGGVGFVFDTAVVYGLRGMIGLYWSGAIAFLVAATVTWIGNRLWTFRGRGTGTVHRQWAKFVVANTGGFVLNRGTYALLVTFSVFCATNPVFAIAAGVVAGMFLNFHLSRTVVFR